VELLATVFTGAQFGFEASPFFEAGGDAPRIGQLFLLIDPGAFGYAGFAARVRLLLNAVLAQPGARVPGMQRYERRAAALADGLVIPPGL
jgi:(2R)-3-sulfolactate dehydrogenase (NADP+)